MTEINLLDFLFYLFAGGVVGALAFYLLRGQVLRLFDHLFTQSNGREDR